MKRGEDMAPALFPPTYDSRSAYFPFCRINAQFYFPLDTLDKGKLTRYGFLVSFK